MKRERLKTKELRWCARLVDFLIGVKSAKTYSAERRLCLKGWNRQSVQGGGYDLDGKQNSILGEHRFDRGDVVL